MSDVPFIEKRTYPRFPVTIPLEYNELDNQRSGTAPTRDISAIGVCIVAQEELCQGQLVDVCLQMPDNSEQIYRRGKVAWVIPSDRNTYRIGIQIEEPKLKPISIVLRVIKVQKKL
jgi:hypothetical protein